MPTFADSITMTTTGTGEVTSAMDVPGGARLIEISIAGLDADAVPTEVRLDFPGITTPQRYNLGLVALFATSGASIQRATVPIDLTLPATINRVVIGLKATAAGTWQVGLKWVK